MKRNYILFAVAAIAAAASCQKAVQTGSEPQAGDNEMVFNASAEETRAILSEKDINWEMADQIAVYDGAVLNNFVAVNVDGKVATFGGSAADADNYTAVYPAAAAALTEGALSVTIPVEQTVDATHPVDPAAIVAVAQAEKEGGFSFANRFSLVKVTIAESGINSVLLEGLGAENIAGTAALAADLTVGEGSATQVVLKYAGGEAFPAGSYYIAIYPTTFTGGFSIILSKTDGAKGMKQTTAETQFARNGGVDLKTLTVGTWVPSEIMNANQLKMWGIIAPYYTADETVKLGADIDFAGAQWDPADNFKGTFDGQNHRIYNIVMNAANAEARYGFVSKLDAGTFKNTCFGSSDYDFAKGDAADAGTWDNTSLIELKNDLTPTGWLYAGPIAYTAAGGKLQNVVNFMPVTATDATNGQIRLGGITAICKENCTIDGCVNFGSVLDNAFGCTTTNNKCAHGGICGWIDNGNTLITNCTNWGDVTNLNPTAIRSAGIVGTTSCVDGSSNTVSNCVNHGILTNKCECIEAIYLGGIVGMTDTKTIIDKCTNWGDIMQTDASPSTALDFGGIVGYVRSASIVKGCVNKCSFVGTKIKCGNHAYIGGIAGASKQATITKSDDGQHTTNSASIEQTVDFAKNCLLGGIVGYISGTTPVSYSDNSGNVSTNATNSDVNTKNFFGGIAGLDNGKSAFDHCTNSGDVTGYGAGNNMPFHIGGIVGGNASPASVADCSNSGKIYLRKGAKASYGGGICAMFDPNTATMTNCSHSGSLWMNRDNILRLGGLAGSVKVNTGSAAKTIFEGCSVSCEKEDNQILYATIVSLQSYVGIVVGEFTGTSTADLVMGSTTAPVRIEAGTIVFNKTDNVPLATIDASNVGTYMFGAANAADEHRIINYVLY